VKLSSDQRAARRLQEVTKAPYQTCLNMVRTELVRLRAEEIRNKDGMKAWRRCLFEAALPLIEVEG
jgi:hypothetical protein